MTRHVRRQVMKEALRLSFDTKKLTYALIKGDDYVITQDEKEKSHLIGGQSYRLYAKCKDGRLVFHWDE